MVLGGHIAPIIDSASAGDQIRGVEELTLRRILFGASLLTAPAVLFLVQVIFIVPPILLLAAAGGMAVKLVTNGFGRENMFLFLITLVTALLLAAPFWLAAWLLGKIARLLPARWQRIALLVVLLAGLAWVTQLPIYGGGGHGPGKFGNLQTMLADLARDFGAVTMILVYVGGLVLVSLPMVIGALRRSSARAATPPRSASPTAR